MLALGEVWSNWHGGWAARESVDAFAEYARLMGKDAGAAKTTGFPTPMQLADAARAQLADPLKPDSVIDVIQSLSGG